MRRLDLCLLASLIASGSVACARSHAEPTAEPVADGGAQAVETTGAALDGGASQAPAPPGPKPDGVEVYAFREQAPIFSATEYPPREPQKTDTVIRLGYLRRGEHVLAKPGIITKANCAEGWHALVQGGFVCGKFVTTDAKHRDLKFAPHAPNLDKPLPYDYGLVLTPGTPLYRRIPTKTERSELEKTLAVGRGSKAAEIAKGMKERGEELPAYLKDAQNKKSHAGFKELAGDSELLAQRMLKGFYISLDKKVEGKSGLMWHTTNGYLTPSDHILLHKGKTEFEGVRLSDPAEKRKLPLAFVVGTKARRYDKEGTRTDEKIDRFTIAELTGTKHRIGKHLYWEAVGGHWLVDEEIAVVEKPTEIPNDLAPNEKWIDVDLSGEALVAFEGDKPVYATIVSTGRHSADAERDHRTVTGSFRIREKHITTTMDDDASSDGTYRIDDVPWVMYFEKSFALHGAFWHSSFGRERSHGCVNLTPHDARNIFAWAGPTVPEGWHGVKATKENPGTRVVVHK